MSSQFEWQAGDDDRWETIARVTKEDHHGWRRRMPRWLWVALLAVLAAGVTGGYGVVRHCRFLHCLQLDTGRNNVGCDLQ